MIYVVIIILSYVYICDRLHCGVCMLCMAEIVRPQIIDCLGIKSSFWILSPNYVLSFSVRGFKYQWKCWAVSQIFKLKSQKR